MRRRNPAELLLLNPGTPDDFFVWVPSVHHTQRFNMPVQPQEVWLALDVTPTNPPMSKVFDPSTGEVVGERPFRPAHGVNALVQEAGNDWRWHNGVLTLNSHTTAPHMKKGAWLFVRAARRNPAATRTLTMGEVQHVMHDLQVPKAWRTRFMQGLNVEWSEHGGGIDVISVGSLVIDHLNEDEDYYRKSRRNPSPLPEGFTTRFGINVPDDYVAPPLPESRRVLRDLQSDDIVTVGRTQWVISRSAGDSQAYAYKYPSKRTKLYVIEGTGPNTPDTVIVYEVGGSGQRISEDVAMGPLRLTY